MLATHDPSGIQWTRGAELDKPYPVEYAFYCKSEEEALLLCTELQNQGYSALEPESDEDAWRVVVHKEATLNEVTKNTLALVELATNFGGMYDGWGASI